MSALLEARGLVRHFRSGNRLFDRATVRAVDGIDLSLASGGSLGIVGESGCGKSTLGRLLLGLLPASSGEVRFDGEILPRPDSLAWSAQRREMQLVFQDPLAALNPRLTIGEQVAEPLAIHGIERDPQKIRAAAIEAMVAVGLAPDQADRLPHQLSGGQRQRVVIGRVLTLRPRLVVFDEPVSALDVSIQAQIVNLIRDLRERYGLSYVFISHDLRIIRQVADEVAVMYLGRIVERGPADAVFTDPRHPYTQALLSSVPKVGRGASSTRIRLAGEPPSPVDPPSGCAFHPRCAVAVARCRSMRPELTSLGSGHAASCHLLDPVHAVAS